MKSVETVIADLECAKFMFCAPELLDRQKLITIEQAINAGIELLKKQQQIIENYQKADSFLATHGWRWDNESN